MNKNLKDHTVTIYKGNGGPIMSQKIKPNDPCKCGSGRKAKRCCGTRTRYYNTKPNKDII